MSTLLPKVSIVIPAYKAGHFGPCLRSALGQTYPNVEILVSDNCPTDAVQQVCARHPGVIYQRSDVLREKNVLSAFYSGKGAFIKPLFDDDILHPFCVERMVAAMTMRADIGLVFSASQVIDADNQRSETRRPYQASGFLNGRDLHRSMTLGLCNVIGEFSSIMFRRETLWDIGWHHLFVIGDHDFTLGLADLAGYCNLLKGRAAFYIDEELTYFRRDQRLQSNSNGAANPYFGYCFSDYIDLLIASHAEAVVTGQEVLDMQPQIAALQAKLGGVFTQVAQSHQRYMGLIAKLSKPV
jgi:glycosyltransferase involved in cell wall biosynthesis